MAKQRSAGIRERSHFRTASGDTPSLRASAARDPVIFDALVTAFMLQRIATDSCFCKQLILARGRPSLDVMASNAKEAFSARLNQVCAEAGQPERGRRVGLAKVAGVSGEAARKWLSGEAIPAMDHIAVISAHYRVQAQWLLTGLGRKDVEGEADTLTDEEREHIKRLRSLPAPERARAFRVVDALISPAQQGDDAA